MALGLTTHYCVLNSPNSELNYSELYWGEAMRPDIQKGIKKIDTKDWKKVPLEYGRNVLEILVPRSCVELSMMDVPVLSDPRSEVEKAISNPIQSPTIEEIVKKKGKPPEQLSVAVTVSDITRPVPYHGEGGILIPILRRLESSGIPKQNIKIIVGTGTHRASTPEEKIEMFGEAITREYAILDHNCEDQRFPHLCRKNPSRDRSLSEQ